MSGQKKDPARGGTVAGRLTAHSAPFPGTTSPRHVRVLRALMAVHKLAREDLDRVAGASNGPDIVAALRRKGLDIPCVLREGIDRDGRPCKTGEYSLTESDRAALAVWRREQADLIAASRGHHA